MEKGNKGIFEASFHPKESRAMSCFCSTVCMIYIDEQILRSSISSVCLNLSKKISLCIGSFKIKMAQGTPQDSSLMDFIILKIAQLISRNYSVLQAP